jgi:hypothetical protein
MNTRVIAWITGSLTFLLALFSFILSFNALTDLAARHHISIPYLFPLVVEAGVVIFSLNALYRSLLGEHATWQWVLIIGSSLLAGMFNILHSEPDLVSRIMAAMPSLFLLLSFESFLNQIKHGVKRSAVVQSIAQLTTEFEQKQAELDTLVQAGQAEIDSLTQEADKLHTDIEQAQITLGQLEAQLEQAKRAQLSSIEQAQDIKAEKDAISIEHRRNTLLQILMTEGDLGATAFADRLNISRGTVYSDLKALHEAGLIVKNGQGWELTA